MNIEPPVSFDSTDNLLRKDTEQLKNNMLELLLGKSKIEKGVIALDAAWGEGKTTFLQMLKKEIVEKDEDTTVVLYNAWENDHIEEPFVSLVSEIVASTKKRKDKLRDAAKSVAKNLLNDSPKILDAIFAAVISKIEWGGLVVKAGLSDYPKAVILGALIVAKAQLETEPESYRLFELKGDAAFMGYLENEKGDVNHDQ